MTLRRLYVCCFSLLAALLFSPAAFAGDDILFPSDRIEMRTIEIVTLDALLQVEELRVERVAPELAPLAEVAAIGVLHPVYDLSYRTDAHSILPRRILRC